MTHEVVVYLRFVIGALITIGGVAFMVKSFRLYMRAGEFFGLTGSDVFVVKVQRRCWDLQLAQEWALAIILTGLWVSASAWACAINRNLEVLKALQGFTSIYLVGLFLWTGLMGEATRRDRREPDARLDLSQPPW